MRKEQDLRSTTAFAGRRELPHFLEIHAQNAQGLQIILLQNLRNAWRKFREAIK